MFAVTADPEEIRGFAAPVRADPEGERRPEVAATADPEGWSKRERSNFDGGR